MADPVGNAISRRAEEKTFDFLRRLREFNRFFRKRDQVHQLDRAVIERRADGRSGHLGRDKHTMLTDGLHRRDRRCDPAAG